MDKEPIGRQGFVCMQDAYTDALLSMSEDIIMVKQDDEYGWLYPREYADQMISSGYVEEVYFH